MQCAPTADGRESVERRFPSRFLIKALTIRYSPQSSHVLAVTKARAPDLECL
jgi:hypothetical protein